MIRRALLLLPLCSALSLPVSAWAGDGEVDVGPKPVAVQNRMHTQRHEYALWVGVLPMDAFTKGLTFTGGYTLHFSDLLAWEVGQFTYSIGLDTRLRDELESLPQPVGPTPFETVRYFATSNFVFKPVYGKVAVLNRTLLSHEWFFVVGGGAGRLTISSRPVVDFGLGMRVYGGEHVSFRLDVRDYLFFNADDTENELWFALGFSLDFGR